MRAAIQRRREVESGVGVVVEAQVSRGVGWRSMGIAPRMFAAASAAKAMRIVRVILVVVWVRGVVGWWVAERLGIPSVRTGLVFGCV